MCVSADGVVTCVTKLLQALLHALHVLLVHVRPQACSEQQHGKFLRTGAQCLTLSIYMVSCNLCSSAMDTIVPKQSALMYPVKTHFFKSSCSALHLPASH